MIGHDFPYLDTKDLNLDWLLKNMKKIIQEWANYQAEMNQSFSELNEAFVALKSWVETYFTELDVQQEINNKIDSMIESGELIYILQPVISSEVGDWLSEHITNPSSPPVDTSLSVSGAAADAKVTGDHIFSLEERIRIDESSCGLLSKYLYKENTYINGSGEEAEYDPGYNLYRIPFNGFSAIYLEWDPDSPFYYETNRAYVFDFIKAGATPVSLDYFNANAEFYYLWLSAGKAIIFNADNYDYLSILAYETLSGSVKITLIDANSHRPGAVVHLNENNSVKIPFTFNGGNTTVVTKWNASEISYLLPVKQGDKFSFESIAGYSYLGIFIDSSTKTVSRMSLSGQIISAGGYVIALSDSSVNANADIFYPIDSIKIEYKNVIDNESTENAYNGLSGVAFGTSLTARAYEDHKYETDTYGYLTYLRDFSGMTIANEGIGGAGLLSDGKIYDAIMNYTGYSGKRFCIIEGFVNDWYHEATLGNYTDDTSSTVCGRLRECINFIMAQNANITLFVVLDHYGRERPGISEASTEIRGGRTQYQYYDELAKVCDSLGIPTVKQYAISQISENTPQYFADDIHMNDLGARKSAHVIWDIIGRYYPNVIS